MARVLGKLLGKGKTGTRQAQEAPDPQEAERAFDERWLARPARAPAVVEVWRRVEACEGTGTSGQEARSFREVFADTMEDWVPSHAEVQLPLRFLRHFVGALDELAEALSSVDSSLPRTKAAEHQRGLTVTLRCLKISTRGPLNMRPLLDAGLVPALARLVDAQAAVVEPLARQVRCLAFNPEANTTDVLLEKAAQVRAAMELRSGMMAASAELLRELTSIVQLQGHCDGGVSVLRSPVSARDVADALRKSVLANAPVPSPAGPNAIQVVSHALGAIVREALPCCSIGVSSAEELFNASLNLLETLRFVAQQAGVDADEHLVVAAALLQCLQWPRECSFRREGVLEALSPVDLPTSAARDPAFDPDQFHLPSIDRDHLFRYSDLQRAALRTLSDVLAHSPQNAPSLLKMRLFERVSEACVWHMLFFGEDTSAADLSGKLCEVLPQACWNPQRPPPGVEDSFVGQEGDAASSRTLLSVADPQPEPVAGVLAAAAALGRQSSAVREMASSYFTARQVAAEKHRRKTGTPSGPASAVTAAEGAMFDAADRLEFLALGLFDLVLPPGAARPPGDPPPLDLVLGLQRLQGRYELQLFTLSTLLGSIQALEGMGVGDNMSRIVQASRNRGGVLLSTADVLVPLGIHRVLLSDLFYFAGFEPREGRVREQNLRPRWEGSEEGVRGLQCLMRRCSCHLLTVLGARAGGRNVSPDVAAVLDVLRRHAASVEVVIDMTSMLLTPDSSQREVRPPSLPPLLRAASLDERVAVGLMETVTLAFSAMHSSVRALQLIPPDPPPSATDQLPPGVLPGDLPRFERARELLLNVLEEALTVSTFQGAALAGDVKGAGLGRCKTVVGVFFDCLRDSEPHRDFAKEHLKHLLFGPARKGQTLGDALRPLMHEIFEMISCPETPRDLVRELLLLIRDVLCKLEEDERALLLSAASPTDSVTVARRVEATRRRRALQSVDSHCYLRLVSSLNARQQGASEERPPPDVELCLCVLDTLGWCLRGNPAARERFREDIGWSSLVQSVMHALQDNPPTELVDVFLDLLVEGSFGEGRDVTFHNEHVLPVILQDLCLHPRFTRDTDLQLQISKRLRRALSGSTHNLACAASAGAFGMFVELMMHFDNGDLREQYCRCVERVGRHSVTVKQLKDLFARFKLLPAPQRSQLVGWVIRVLHKLAKQETTAEMRHSRHSPHIDTLTPSGEPMARKGSLVEIQRSLSQSFATPHRTPPSFFDFSALHSGLRVPDCSGYPGSGGYTVLLWLRVESHQPSFLLRAAVHPVRTQDGVGSTRISRTGSDGSVGQMSSSRRQVVGPAQAGSTWAPVFEPRLWSFLWPDEGCSLEAYLGAGQLHLCLNESGAQP
eukprot:Hpha_TRINITY_DN10101_c0_g1::TRINITY_DN10101_c0_g1_i1::g.131561::m.131561